MLNGFDGLSMIGISQTAADRARLDTTVQLEMRDDIDYAGIVVKKPWGKEWQVFRNPEFSIWRLQIDPRAETSMHCHPGKTTMLIVQDGEVEITTLGKQFSMQPGNVLVIERGTFHRTSSKAGAVVMEIESPPIKADLVRIEDRYGRAGKGYESCG